RSRLRRPLRGAPEADRRLRARRAAAPCRSALTPADRVLHFFRHRGSVAPRRGADVDGLLPHLQIGLAAVTLEQTEIATEGRGLSRGLLRITQPGLFVGHARLAQPGEKRLLRQRLSLAIGLYGSEPSKAGVTPVAAQPARLDKLCDSFFHVPFKRRRRGQPSMRAGKSWIGASCSFDPQDRLIELRLQQMNHADPPKPVRDIRIAWAQADPLLLRRDNLLQLARIELADPPTW